MLLDTPLLANHILS